MNYLADAESTVVAIFFVLFIVGSCILAALPTIIAFVKHHPNRWIILGINFFLGATGVGWFVALIWSLNLYHIKPKGADEDDDR